MYTVPEKYFYRLHHPRPRFKNNIESVLLFMAAEICALGELNAAAMRLGLNRAIRHFPGNMSRTDKTIDNWRTEITSLLGLMEYTEQRTIKPSALAYALDKNQDLIQFFRYFCFKFQYPGGHIKPHETALMINKGIKFKPVKYILLLLEAGRKRTRENFGISKEELTHCVFNDLRVTRDKRSPEDTAELILENRALGISYQGGGDVIRYAGDILDYMELANLVYYRPNGSYYLRTHEYEVINAFKSSNEYFHDYEDLYSSNQVNSSDVRATQNNWFAYVNLGIDPSMFQTDIYNLLIDSDNETIAGDNANNKSKRKQEISQLLMEIISTAKNSNQRLSTKKIGDLGEAITIQHEKTRLIQLNLENLAKKVVKIPETMAAGYDIKSYEGVGEMQRLIEVKTTISKNRVNAYRFQMTPNEWGSAETFGSAYFIYRLMIYDGDINLFIIQDPVASYKSDKVRMIPRNGVEIIYTDDSGSFERVLL